MQIRTRIAPSPTGSPHIGTAYIALFNYAFAKSQGGRFILRIEDTDQARSTQSSEDAILDALRWIGVPWDEGPDVGGPSAPYRQSERLPTYRRHVADLCAADHAYPCFCTAERLNAVRREQTAAGNEFVGYDGACSRLSASEAGARVAAGEAHVYRLRVPREGECVFQDRLRGEVRIPWAMVDDQVLLKTDGFPTYHLACVVDDHLMEISHVIRGEEWISSTPKHVRLYDAFGWTPPAFAHLPLLRNPDKSKLSKRKNPTSILYYRQAGFLPEALLNFLGLMAYSMPDGREEFSRDEMVAAFDLGRVSLGGPIFDLAKLRNFNGRYLRALAPEALYARAREWMLNDATWARVVPLAQPRLEQLTDLVPLAAFLFADRVPVNAAALAERAGAGERACQLLRVLQWEIEKTAAWNVETVRGLFERVGEKEGIKLKQLMPVYFLALTGAEVSLPVYDAMIVIGRDMCLRRIQYALEALQAAGHALAGKALKEFSAAYEAAYGAKA